MTPAALLMRANVHIISPHYFLRRSGDEKTSFRRPQTGRSHRPCDPARHDHGDLDRAGPAQDVSRLRAIPEDEQGDAGRGQDRRPAGDLEGRRQSLRIREGRQVLRFDIASKKTTEVGSRGRPDQAGRHGQPRQADRRAAGSSPRPSRPTRNSRPSTATATSG